MSPLTEPTRLVLRQTYIGTDDPDAAAYIAAVEAADGQALETATRVAIHSFVKGCKADGIWPAIKAACIMAGARTLNGALRPLVGTAPTNFNFVAGDYNRKTGLVGNGSSKYLNANRLLNEDASNNCHFSVYISVASTNNSFYIATDYAGGNDYSAMYKDASSNQIFSSCRNDETWSMGAASGSATGLIAASRSSQSQYLRRIAGSTTARAVQSLASRAYIWTIFARNAGNHTNARLAFYSIGESLDLALLDARVTTLINALAIAIP